MNKHQLNALAFLKKNKTILYPTDTVWGIGCDATSTKAVAEIYRLKKRTESKALIILVSSINMLEKYVTKVPEKVLTILEKATQPTTIIFQNPIGLADNLIHKKDNSVAIRVVTDEFCNTLITAFGKPIVSTSANISGNPTPSSFSDIDTVILKGVDYVVNLRTDEISTKSSTILKIIEDRVEVLRE